MLPELDRALLLGGLLALASAFFALRWGWQLLRALWRRLNVRRGTPYLTGSISSYGGRTALALGGLALGGFVCLADVTMRDTGVLDRDVVDVGRLMARAAGGRIDVSLQPAASASFAASGVTLDGERWRLTGSLIQWSGVWRFFGIPDGYRVDAAEAASGALGRPAAWKVTRATLLAPDRRFALLCSWAGRIPGVRIVPHATDWEPALDGPVTLVVTPAGYAFLPVDDG